MRSSLVAFLAFAALGCSNTPSRTVTGQLKATTFALDNPVVLAEAADSRVFVAHLGATGKFALKLPSNVAYRLTLANSTATKGIYSSLATINWPLEKGGARWASLGDGETLDLGMIYEHGKKVSGGSGSGSSSSGSPGDCKEEDDSKCSHEGEGECDCSHGYSGGDKCEPDGNSGGDESNCNKDHGYGGGSGGSGHGKCDGGSAGGSGSGGGGGSAGGGGGEAGGSGSAGGGGSGGTVGSPCQTNDDCETGLTCMDNSCTRPVIS